VRHLGKPPPNVGVAARTPTHGGGRAQSPSFQDAVVSAGTLKPAVVNAAFALVERVVQHDDGSSDTVFELRILDNLPGSRAVSCVLSESVTDKCTVDNESWFADPFELVHYHQRVPYCIDHAPSGRCTMYFLRAVEAVPEDVVGQARVAAQAFFFPVNLRFLGSIVFYAQVRLHIYVYVHTIPPSSPMLPQHNDDDDHHHHHHHKHHPPAHHFSHSIFLSFFMSRRSLTPPPPPSPTRPVAVCAPVHVPHGGALLS
jgi:hypothetical protein